MITDVNQNTDFNCDENTMNTNDNNSVYSYNGYIPDQAFEQNSEADCHTPVYVDPNTEETWSFVNDVFGIWV